MTVSLRVCLPRYAREGIRWNVNALEDQQLAGLLMWVPSGVVFIVFGLALFAAWLGESDKRVALGSMSTSGSRIPLTAGGRDEAR